jgi:peptidoglycan-associated lipoprotein
MKATMKICILVMGLIVLNGCSKNLPGVSVNDAKATGAKSRGLGSRIGFSGQEKGEVFTTKAPHNQIYLFAFDNSTLANKYLASLNAQANYLMSHAGAQVMIAGHTDSRGSREYNIALGERRAKTVSNLLQVAGVNRNQIRVVSYGEERPVAFGHEESSYRLNRRVELTYEAIR